MATAQREPEVTQGVRLYMARRSAGLDQKDIAEALTDAGYPTSRALVSMWERDEGREPGPARLRVVAQRTDTSYAWLVGATEASRAIPGQRESPSRAAA